MLGFHCRSFSRHSTVYSVLQQLAMEGFYGGVALAGQHRAQRSQRVQRAYGP